MPTKLTYEDFLKSFELAPRVAIELLVVNQNGAILLLKRDREPFANTWHLPGGFLLKDEKISECIERLSRDELSFLFQESEGKFVGFFESIHQDPRGHILHYVVKFHSQEISTGEYFQSLPKNIIPYQRDFLSKIST